ncbi:MAG: DUF3997 domain-containing protein [Oscillospiraceae bacterium]|jgi:hypothetical protein|nr:DUF3997 domain-containing protein [Oscillospiraceae bacterium]
MKKIMLVAVLLMMAAALTSCSFNSANEEASSSLDYGWIPVGNGYEISKTSVHQIMIAPIRGWGANDPIIPATVVEYASDERWILAKQIGFFESSDLEHLHDYSKTNYWILDTKDSDNAELYGPFTEESEFNAKRVELGVPEGLKLQSVS